MTTCSLQKFNLSDMVVNFKRIKPMSPIADTNKMEENFGEVHSKNVDSIDGPWDVLTW